MKDTDIQNSSRWLIPAIAVGSVATVGAIVGIWYARTHRNEGGERKAARDGGGQWLRINETVRIDAPVAAVYGFWRDLENLEANMANVHAVEGKDSQTLHWEQKGPLGIWTAEWDAKITEDEKNSTIAWRSTADSQVPTNGRVRFAELKGEKATALTFTAEFQPPGGAVGAFFGRAIFPMIDRQVRRDLYRVKSAMEAGQARSHAGGNAV